MLLNHYIHFVTQHQNENDLNDIYNELISMNDMDNVCNTSNGRNCSFFVRHNRSMEYNNQDENADDEFLFYQELLDTVHCFIYHLQDATTRRMQRETDKQNDQEKKYQNNDEYNSNEYMRENSKFVIDIREVNNDADKEKSLMDHLLEYLQKWTKIKNMKLWLEQNEFDSEAIEYDVVDDNSNLKSYYEPITGPIYIPLKNYFRDIQLYSSTFNIGYRLYYWVFYKNAAALDDNEIEEWLWNKNDHGGYKQHQLYVSPKYKTIKDEVLNNTIFALGLYSLNVSIKKTEKYMNAGKVKGMVVRQVFGQNDPLKYNLKNGTPITFHHILAIILYCDESDLSREFSKTFRKTSLHQTIAEIIKQNQQYAVWSRLCRETVEYYGHKGFGDVVEKTTINSLIGPFYCGLSVEMALPEFSIRLASPTSTSLQEEIAIRFAGEEGLLMRLNNNGTEISGDLRGFLCSWLSNYPLEAEVLFIGGEYRMKIESVSTITTQQNFSPFFQVLFLFNCMLNGSVLNGHYINDIAETQRTMLDHLIEHKLKVNGFTNTVPEYINDTFEAYTNNKKEIILNLHEIDTNLSKIAELILYGVKKTKIFNPTKC
eukprot:151818_1